MFLHVFYHEIHQNHHQRSVCRVMAAMVSRSVTRTLASSAVRGDPMGPPVFCAKNLLLYSKYELSRWNEMSVSNAVGEILDGKSDG